MVVKNKLVPALPSMIRTLFSNQLRLLRALQRRTTSIGTVRKETRSHRLTSAKSLRGTNDQTDPLLAQVPRNTRAYNLLAIPALTTACKGPTQIFTPTSYLVPMQRG
jgi:hypothetical protein